MSNSTEDNFEAIAKDAVELLLAIVGDLQESEDAEDKVAALFIATATESFCLRAIALGAK